MTQLKEKTATYANIEALLPHVVDEILFGTLVTHPRPPPRHGAAASALGALTGASYQLGTDGPGSWIFGDEPALHFAAHIAVPDIAGWRHETMSETPRKDYFDIASDWVCEVLSPSTEKYDRGDKRKIYAQSGIDHLWFVDPRSQLLEVFARRGTDWLLAHPFTETQDIVAPPFTELTFALGLLWPFYPLND